MSRFPNAWSYVFSVLAILLIASAGCDCVDPGFDRCVPLTCDDAGKNCGSINDGCDGRINCGYCGAGYVCGLNEANVCGYTGSGGNGGDDTGDITNPLYGCSPYGCLESGIECGVMGNGCGHEQICGFCGGGMDCGGGHEPGRCGQSVCTPTTCDAVGAQCGQYPDGCGGVLSCGECADGLTCGGGGAYRCGSSVCNPSPNCNNRCGFVADGCAGVVSCPGCAGSQLCTMGSCIDGAGSIGNTCSSHQSCLSGRCLTAADTGWTGGYCTSACGSDADCGDGNVCGYLNESGSGICLKACDGFGCRSGYVCAIPEGGSESACIPGGTGAGGVSAPCSTSADCDGGAEGLCLRPEDGFPGGYCTLTCGETPCPAGTACAFDSAGRGICVKLCSSSDDCSGDYRCRDLGGGIRACWPAGNLGESCNEHEDCASDVCLSAEPHGWTGGYCTDLCNSNDDCGAGNQCVPYGPNGQYVCAVGCSTNADCRDGYACTVTTGGGRACLPYGGGTGQIGDACTTTADCAGGEDAVCVSTPSGGRCSIRCHTSQDCPAGETCITDAGVVPGFCQLPGPPIDNCISDQDCGPGKICVQTPAGRICGNMCSSDQDCPSGTRCTTDPVFGGVGFCQEVSPGGPGAGEPGSPCTRGSDCISGICITQSMGYPGGYCAQPCDNDLDCGVGQICGPGGPAGQDICMPECDTNRDCRPGYVCTDMGGGRNACTPEHGDGEAGDPCATTADCAGGHVCVETYPGNKECVETCDGAGQCDEGMACRPVNDGLGTGTCQPGDEHECSSDADCPPGQTCGVSLTTQNLKCIDEDDGGVDWGWPDEGDWGGPGKTGDPCTDGGECERMQCYTERDMGWSEGYCTGTCSSNQDCSSGSTCGLQRVLKITTDSSGGFDIKDVTDVFGYEPGYGVTINTSAVTKLIIRVIIKWLLDNLFGDHDGTVVIGSCLKTCSADNECRFGYKCMQVHADGTKGCIPYADGPGKVGEPCRLINECGGDMRGYCLLEGYGYPGGYCSINCNDRGSYGACPAGSRCVKLEDSFTCMTTTPCDLNTLGAVCDWWRCEPAKYCLPPDQNTTARIRCTADTQCTGDDVCRSTCWLWNADQARWYWSSQACCDTGRSCTPLSPCPLNQAVECTAHRKGLTGFCSRCVGDERCRTDYACYSPDGNRPGVCHPSAKGSRGINEPCTRLRDCAGGVDGFCFEEAEVGGGEPNAWPGGYCSRVCRRDGNCPSGSTCVELVTGGKYCFKTCYSGSWWRSGRSCRDGYTCHDRGFWRSNACVYHSDIVHK